MNGETIQLPPQASTLAPEVDSLYYFIFWGCAFFFVLILGLCVLFILRYRRREGEPVLESSHHNTTLEFTWSVIPLILAMVVFVWGFRSYMSMSVAPANTLDYTVVGKRWLWEITHPNGLVAINEMTVPQGRPVKVLLRSEDVIHSFFVPAFRVKQDALPNRYTTLWFEATMPGDFDLFCTEYCGTGHSTMLAKVHVLAPAEYDAWVEAQATDVEPTPEAGEKLYVSKACVTCHTLDGSVKTGPSFKGLFGRQEPLADGTSVLVDENYLRTSILEPGRQVVAGFSPVMPAYAGMLKPNEIDALIAYIKTVN
jgi:cytochrome c oxidase subunit 2